MNMFNHAQLWKKYLSKEYLSLKKHKVKWGVQLSKHKPPHSYTHSFLSTTKYLRKIKDWATNSFYTFCYMLIVLKNFL